MKELLIILFSLTLLCPPALSAVDFDGTDDFINMGDLSDVDFDSGNFALSAWLKTDDASSGQTFFSKDDGSAQRQFVFGMAGGGDGQVGYWKAGPTIVIQNTLNNVFSSGVWYHFVAQRNGSSFEIYIDGVSKAMDSLSGTHGTMGNFTSNVRIGGKDDGNSDFDGQITDVAIWNTALSAPEIAQLADSKVKRMPLQIQPEHLVGYWPLDDFADGSYNKAGFPHEDDANCVMMLHMDTDVDPLPDSSGNGNTGALKAANEPNYVTTTHLGDGAYDFDGDDDYVNFGDILDSVFTGNTFTIAAWVNPDNVSGTYTIFSKYVATGNQRQFWYHQINDTIRMAVTENDAANYTDYTSGSILSALTWNHLVLVVDKTQSAMNDKILLYYNGSSVSITTASSTFPSMSDVTAPLWLADYGGAEFPGKIDEVAIYDRALSADEIAAIYAYNTFRDISPVKTSETPGYRHQDDPNCVMYLPMDVDEDPIQDAAGTNNGALKAADEPDFTTTAAAGGGAYDFDGGDDYVDIDNVIGDIQSTTEGTISLWAKFPTQSSSNRIISFSDSGDNPGWSTLDLYATANNRIGIYIAEAGTAQLYFWTDDNVATWDNDNWHHIVLAVGSSGNAFYVDGTQITDLVYSTGNSSTQKWFNSVNDIDQASIGRRDWGPSGVYFDGLIDEVAIYDRELTPAEIANIYSANTIRSSKHGIPDAGADSSLVGAAEEALSYP